MHTNIAAGFSLVLSCVMTWCRCHSAAQGVRQCRHAPPHPPQHQQQGRQNNEQQRAHLIGWGAGGRGQLLSVAPVSHAGSGSRCASTWATFWPGTSPPRSFTPSRRSASVCIHRPAALLTCPAAPCRLRRIFAMRVRPADPLGTGVSTAPHIRLSSAAASATAGTEAIPAKLALPADVAAPLIIVPGGAADAPASARTGTARASGDKVGPVLHHLHR